jgi:hypothetical protein
MAYISGLLATRFRIVVTNRFQPIPIHRLVFHPSLPLSLPGTPRGVSLAVDAIERAARRFLPRAMWAYLHVRAIREG